MRFLFTLLTAGLLTVSTQAQQAGSVMLTSFNAVARNSQVLLSWQPGQTGAQTYQLEKSKNGTEFVAFGNVQGADVVPEFIETDFHPFEGLSYYRLRITNTDGTIGFSNVVPVKYNDNGQPVSPIAVAGDQNTVKDKTVLVVVRASSGEEFYSKVQVAADGNPIECNNPDPLLGQGTYTIIGCSEQELYARQMVVK